VEVFVGLYLKARQTGDQAGRLSERLEAVEETAAELRALPAVSGDAEAAETAARLSGRVSRLRDALDALGVD
jgi:hypothetical protein